MRERESLKNRGVASVSRTADDTQHEKRCQHV